MQTRQGLASILAYCKQDKKTLYNGKRLVSGINCVAESAFNEMMTTKINHHKTNGRMYYHLFQSFHPNENLTPEIAHEIALKFAEENFNNYEVLVATHIDREHLHSHFIVNSVSFENGKKYHSDKDEIQKLRDYSDKLCREYGLSVVTPQPQKTKQMSAREYRSADKGQSWKLQLAIAIDEAMKFAKSKEHFISLMEIEGYEIKWTAERKYITYTTPHGMKCRDNKLHEEKYLKENMENEFRIRKEILYGIKESGETEKSISIKSYTDCYSNGRKLESIDSTQQHDDRVDGVSIAGASDQCGFQCSDQLHQEEKRGTAELNESYCYTDENGERHYVETDWESEREEFLVYFTAERENEELYENAILDYSSGKLNYIIDGAYLATEVFDMIDNEYHTDDCTTMRKTIKERKNTKKQGPKFNGM